ncbi:hypothetical protein [Pseudomonas sp.]|uniref:hypothetical protein n=1 Tax=Pseudomonas sp. TaxID=306 RepID=UPI003C326407
MLRTSWRFAALGLALLLGGCNPEGDNPHRAALIDQAIEASVQTIKRREPQPVDREPMSPQLLDEFVADRKLLMGTLTLPQDYWDQYRQNYQLLRGDILTRQERALELLQQQLRVYLRETGSPGVPSSVMEQYYRDANESVGRENIENHVKRMIQLDQRFDVCARFPLCAQE